MEKFLEVRFLAYKVSIVGPGVIAECDCFYSGVGDLQDICRRGERVRPNRRFRERGYQGGEKQQRPLQRMDVGGRRSRDRPAHGCGGRVVRGAV